MASARASASASSDGFPITRSLWFKLCLSDHQITAITRSTDL
jgi:hypothetical protein